MNNIYRAVICAITVCLVGASGCSGASSGSSSSNMQSFAGSSHCFEFAESATEAQLFSGSPPQDYPVQVSAPSGTGITFLSVTNNLNTSPIIVFVWPEGTSQGKAVRVDPSQTNDWSITPVQSVYVQQTLDTFDNGFGVRMEITACGTSSGLLAPKRR